MEIKTCEEYVLRELDIANQKLEKYEELKNQYKYNLGRLSKTLEEMETYLDREKLSTIQQAYFRGKIQDIKKDVEKYGK